MHAIEEQTILITGSTDGIGKIAARRLACRGAFVLLHGRSPKKCESTLQEIRDDTQSRKLAYYVADLASLAAVRKLARDIAADHSKLHVLINNAGVGPGGASHSRRPLSADGLELCFAVNYLAPFLLTQLLIPILKNGAPSRIVNVSSAAQQRIHFNRGMFAGDSDPWAAYAQSKLALTMFTFELAEQLEIDGITVNCLHPGSLLDTKMVREFTDTPLGSAESGAAALIHVASDPDLRQRTGVYFYEKREARAHEQAYDRDARKRLWQLSAALTGIG